MRSSLIELQSIFLSKLQIAPIYCIVMSSFCQRIHQSTDCPVQSASKFFLQFLDQVGIQELCRSVLVMNFDTAKQL